MAMLCLAESCNAELYASPQEKVPIISFCTSHRLKMLFCMAIPMGKALFEFAHCRLSCPATVMHGGQQLFRQLCFLRTLLLVEALCSPLHLCSSR